MHLLPGWHEAFPLFCQLDSVCITDTPVFNTAMLSFKYTYKNLLK